MVTHEKTERKREKSLFFICSSFKCCIKFDCSSHYLKLSKKVVNILIKFIIQENHIFMTHSVTLSFTSVNKKIDYNG